MKRVFCIFLLLLIFPGTGIAEIVVKEEPLTWDKTARLPGDQLYQNLCAACHDSDGSGNGLASAALGITAPDLTLIAANNGGEFPYIEIERLISNSDSRNPHQNTSMPAWEQQFMYFRTGLSSFQREAYARNRILELSIYNETKQLPN